MMNEKISPKWAHLYRVLERILEERVASALPRIPYSGGIKAIDAETLLELPMLEETPYKSLQPVLRAYIAEKEMVGEYIFLGGYTVRLMPSRRGRIPNWEKAIEDFVHAPESKRKEWGRILRHAAARA